jgi:PAS domain S-box-containing protein
MTISGDSAPSRAAAPTDQTASDPSGFASLGHPHAAMPSAQAHDRPGHEHGADLSSDAASKVFAQYREIAAAAMTDAEGWLRQGALSRAIPEAMPDAIMVTDASGTIVLINTQFELMFGYHRSEVIGHTPEMLLPEAARDSHVAHRTAFVNDPRVRAMGEKLNLRGRRKNGVEFTVLIRLGPVVIPDGIFTIAVIRRRHE